VYLWTRNQSACDGPGEAGPDFDPSLTLGQLQLPPRVFCTLGKAGVIAAATRAALAGVTRDAQAASAIAFGWGAARAAKGMGGGRIDAAEKAVIDASFRGNRTAYLAALKRAGANRGLARAALGAELRRIAVETELTVPPAGAGSVAAFADAYAGANARLVTTKTPVAWLGGRTRGIAIAGFVPASVLALPSGRSRLLQTAGGTVEVKALEPPLPLAAVSLATARPAIAAALTKLAKDDAYEVWLQAQEQKLLAVTICLGDDVPAATPLELTSYLPFLALT
jgi:hypothetical protein